MPFSHLSTSQTGMPTFLDTMRTAVKGYEQYIQELEANKKKQERLKQKKKEQESCMTCTHHEFLYKNKRVNSDYALL